MVIEQVSREGVLQVSRENLGLPAAGGLIDNEFLSALLRRAAGILCPCSPATIVGSVIEGLQYVIDDRAALERTLDELTDKLIVVGDLLELNQVTTDDPNVKSTWVFAAPPTFVCRSDGTVFLLGIAADEAMPLPSSLASSVVHEGVARVLIPEPSQNVRAILRDLGWLELSTAAWLKGPKPETAEQVRSSMLRRLEKCPPSGEITDLLLLDPLRDPRYYSRRWSKASNQTGNYVARRPQAHGVPLWGYAAVANGTATRFLDFPLPETRWRGCDAAWRLQLAIDAGLATPQTYRRRDWSGGAFLDFFSPLPLWAERRMSVLGRPAEREKCLFTYWLPHRDVASEEAFLQQQLWLVCAGASEGEYLNAND